MTYTLHYTSADGPGNSTWSVYREQYPDGTDVPIEGTQEHISQWPNQKAAEAEMLRLSQEYWRGRPRALPRIVNDDLPHIVYFHSETRTNFLWTGRIGDPIEVEEGYAGAPVVHHIEVPHMLSMTVLNGGTPPLVLRRFKDACQDWLVRDFEEEQHEQGANWGDRFSATRHIPLEGSE